MFGALPPVSRACVYSRNPTETGPGSAIRSRCRRTVERIYSAVHSGEAGMRKQLRERRRGVLDGDQVQQVAS